MVSTRNRQEVFHHGIKRNEFSLSIAIAFFSWPTRLKPPKIIRPSGANWPRIRAKLEHTCQILSEYCHFLCSRLVCSVCEEKSRIQCIYWELEQIEKWTVFELRYQVVAIRCGFIASVRHCYAHVTLREMKFAEGIINYWSNEDIKTEG